MCPSFGTERSLQDIIAGWLEFTNSANTNLRLLLSLVAVLMHGVKAGKGISCGKTAHGKVSQVFFEQVAKSRR